MIPAIIPERENSEVMIEFILLEGNIKWSYSLFSSKIQQFFYWNTYAKLGIPVGFFIVTSALTVDGSDVKPGYEFVVYSVESTTWG